MSVRARVALQHMRRRYAPGELIKGDESDLQRLVDDGLAVAQNTGGDTKTQLAAPRTPVAPEPKAKAAAAKTPTKPKPSQQPKPTVAAPEAGAP